MTRVAGCCLTADSHSPSLSLQRGSDALSALPQFPINDKFVLNQDEAWYTLSIELQTPIDMVVLQVSTRTPHNAECNPLPSLPPSLAERCSCRLTRGGQELGSGQPLASRPRGVRSEQLAMLDSL